MPGPARRPLRYARDRYLATAKRAGEFKAALTMTQRLSPHHPDEGLDAFFRETRKIKFLRDSKASDHKELEQSLEALVARVEAEREKIADDQSW
jgi:hypothetical protein